MANFGKILGTGACVVSVIVGVVASRGEVKTSKAGLEIIGNAEGCRRNPYRCPAGILTVGVGSTGNVKQRRYTDEEIAQRFEKDIKPAEQCVIENANGKQLPQGVFDSLTSITFNVGCAKMKKSTMFKFVNAGDFKRACKEFDRWIYAGGRPLKGLVERRKQEKALCLQKLK